MNIRAIVSVVCLSVSFSVSAAENGCKLVRVGDLPVTMSGTQPLVVGTINGVEARFLIDSGAAFSMLTQGAIEKYRLKPLQRFSRVTVRGVGGVLTAQGASAERFSLNGFGAGEVKNVQFVVGGSSFGFNVDGIIGQNVIGSFDSEYDLASGVIRLFRTIDCEKQPLAYWAKTGPVAVMPIDATRPSSPHLIGTALLNGNKIGIVFDTGATRSMLTRKAAERAGVKPGGEGVEEGGFSFGVSHTMVKSWLARFDMFDLGGEQIKNARLRFGDTTLMEGADMLLGADFFLSHRIYVAKAQNKVYFTYNGGRVFDLSTSNEGYADSGTTTPTAAPAATFASTPDTAAGFRRRGAASLSRNDARSAMSDFDQAIKLDPSDAENYRQRALAFMKANKTELAITDFNQALVLKPNWTPVLIERGNAHNHIKNTTAAVADFSTAIEASPSDSSIGMQAATLFLNQKKYDEAMRFLDQWIAMYPKDGRRAEALNVRCVARLQMQKELEGALTACEAAVKHIRNSQSLDGRGIALLKLGNFDKSADDFQGALRMQKKRPTSLYGLGLAKIKQGKTADGKKDIDAALALSPKAGEPFRALGIEP